MPAKLPVVVAVVSDLHANSPLALCPAEGVPLDDGGHYQPSASQLWLWECWTDYWRQVAERRDELGASLVVVLNGDLVEGQHHRTVQIVTGNMAAQHAIAMAVLRVPRDLDPDAWFVIRGTEAHVGPSACDEERIASELGAVRDESSGAASWWHLRLEAGGALLEFAHHGSLGLLKWTKHNTFVRRGWELALRYQQEGQRLPSVALFGHLHQIADTYDQAPIRMLMTPAWQYATAYVHRKFAGELPAVGGAILVCRHGAVDVRKVKYEPTRSDPLRFEEWHQDEQKRQAATSAKGGKTRLPKSAKRRSSRTR